jgi:hypothetical protein
MTTTESNLMAVLEPREESKEATKKHGSIFSHDQLRLIVGFVAFALPLLVKNKSSVLLTSISASYHTEAHDIFVGSLFVIATVFFAYNGHGSIWELVISKLGALAAACAAIYPTACDTCSSDIKSQVHGIAAFILFASIVYFCFGPFSKAAKEKMDKALKALEEAKQKAEAGKQKAAQKATNEARERLVVYWICGSVSAICMLIIAAANFMLPVETSRALQITYRGEYVAMWAFGIAWLVAGKIITWVRGKLTFKI